MKSNLKKALNLLFAIGLKLFSFLNFVEPSINKIYPV